MSGISVGLVLPSLSAAAVSRLPAQHYAVGSAVNQATRQIGSVIGVAITCCCSAMARCSAATSMRSTALHIGLALLTAALCAWSTPDRPIRPADPKDVMKAFIVDRYGKRRGCDLARCQSPELRRRRGPGPGPRRRRQPAGLEDPERRVQAHPALSLASHPGQ